MSSNFHRFIIWCTCWDTLSEETGLWQLPNVSSVFKITFWRDGLISAEGFFINLYGPTLHCLFQIFPKRFSHPLFDFIYFVCWFYFLSMFFCLLCNYFIFLLMFKKKYDWYCFDLFLVFRVWFDLFRFFLLECVLFQTKIIHFFWHNWLIISFLFCVEIFSLKNNGLNNLTCVMKDIVVGKVPLT